MGVGMKPHIVWFGPSRNVVAPALGPPKIYYYFLLIWHGTYPVVFLKVPRNRVIIFLIKKVVSNSISVI